MPSTLSRKIYRSFETSATLVDECKNPRTYTWSHFWCSSPHTETKYDPIVLLVWVRNKTCCPLLLIPATTIHHHSATSPLVKQKSYPMNGCSNDTLWLLHSWRNRVPWKKSMNDTFPTLARNTTHVYIYSAASRNGIFKSQIHSTSILL